MSHPLTPLGHIHKNLFPMSRPLNVLGHIHKKNCLTSRFLFLMGLFCKKIFYMSHVTSEPGLFNNFLSICPRLLCTDIFLLPQKRSSILSR